MFKIAEGIFSCGVTHASRRMFDELVPLTQGTSYNSYIVEGSEKTALIDTSYPEKAEEYLKNIAPFKKIDYIVANHGEQDHTGVLPLVMNLHPNARVLTNAKCKQLIVDAMEVDASRIDAVDDNTSIDLGGRTLKFMLAPWVHWPDTMFTYVPECDALFTCDFLGAHTSYDEPFAKEDAETLLAAKRYYAEIMMPFRSYCAKYLEKIEALKPKLILPSHGGVYKNPRFILDAYREWTSPEPLRKALIPYVSMYGNSYKMACALKEILEGKFNVKTSLFDCVNGDIGEYACDIIDAGAIIYSASVVLTSPHPAIASVAYITNLLRPKAGLYAVIGSLGWGGLLEKRLSEFFTNYKPEFLGAVTVKGKPTKETVEQLEQLAEKIASKLPAEA